MLKSYLVPVVVLAITAASDRLAGAQAVDLTEPPARHHISEQLRITVVEKVLEDGSVKTMIQYTLRENGTSYTLSDGTVFTAAGAVYVTYPALNPLRIQVTAAVNSAPDPSLAAVTQLAQALLGVAAALRPDLDIEALKKKIDVSPASADAPGNCALLGEAHGYFDDVTRTLYPRSATSDSLLAQLNEWSAALDAGPGHESIEKVRKSMTATAAVLAEQVKNGSALLAVFESKRRALDETLKANPNDPCLPEMLQARTIYNTIENSRPTARLEELGVVAKSVTDLQESMRPYAASGAWVEDASGVRRNYVVAELDPTAREMRNVEVRAVVMKYDAGLAGFRASSARTATTKFTVMQHAWTVVEIGAGVMLADVSQPKYGTALNDAGETVVSRIGADSVSVVPTAVANFLLRRSGNVLPMLQVGAIASKSAPGFAVGAGLRFFNPRLGFAVGWAHVWVKDLVGLSVGDAVDGTKQIEEALRFQPRDTPFVMIQYTF